MAKNNPATPAAPAVKTASKRSVTVASKLEMNIEIQLCRQTTAAVTGQFGSTKETVFVKEGPIYVIRGVSYPVGQPPKGFPKRPGIAGDEDNGFALTPNVDADFFAEWMRQNADTDMVRNGLIFAHADSDHLDGHAREHEKLNSGLGPMMQDGDPRAPRPLNQSVEAIRTEEERARRAA